MNPTRQLRRVLTFQLAHKWIAVDAVADDESGKPLILG